MKNKKIAIIVTTLVLTCGSVLGVSAAAGAFSAKSETSAGVIKYGDDIIIDGNSIGTWYDFGNTTPVIANNTAANASIILTMDQIKPDSIVDVYYTEASKEAASKAQISYDQSKKGELKLTIKKAASGDICIDKIRVTNPKMSN